MDDGKRKTGPGRGLALGLFLSTLFTKLVVTNCLDMELESIRDEGLVLHDVSIFVEERVEYIHSRISLKPLINGLEHGAKLSNTFSVRANSSLGRILCNKIRQTVTRAERKINRMMNRHLDRMSRLKREIMKERVARMSRVRYGANLERDRVKRSLEIVGNLISKLFGNPGPEEWRQNTRNLLAMKSAIERQMANSILLHKDIDQNRHAINEQNEILKHVSREAISNSNRLNQVDSALAEFETYLEIDTMYSSIFDILDIVDRIGRDGRNGKCNDKGLNRDFLIEHLRAIESNKAGIAPIFASWEWQKYYENSLCSVATHEDELWITMRIPIVNLAEQLVRTIPLSSQLWIKNSLDSIGIDSILFRNKQVDTYMVMTRSNFESCIKLSTFRVCNVRKTKFRQANPFIVPIEIGHGRVIIVSNSSGINSTTRIVCNGVTNSNELQTDVIVKLPMKCSLLGRSFEISKDHEDISINSTISIGQVENVAIRKIKKRKEVPETNLMANLPINNNEFDLNNNKTRENLRNVKISSFTVTETSLIATSGSSLALVIAIVATLVCLKCVRNSESTKIKERNNVFLMSENRDKSMNVLNQTDDAGHSVEMNSNELEIPTSNELNDDSGAKNNSDLDKRKPVFQHKRA
jgi:hypothetical protein